MTRFTLLLLASFDLFGCGLVTDFDFDQNVPLDASALDAVTLDAPIPTSDAQPAIDGGPAFDAGLDAIAPSDAGSDAGAVCEPSEVCDGTDNDCDGMIDEGPTAGSSACPCAIERTAGDVYLFCSGRSVDRAAAQNACQEHGYQLAKLNTSDGIDLVRSVAAGTDTWWIGLSDIATEGTYVWEDGTDLGSANGWALGQPVNDASRDCVSFSGEDVGWVSNLCSSNKGYICSLR